MGENVITLDASSIPTLATDRVGQSLVDTHDADVSNRSQSMDDRISGSNESDSNRAALLTLASDLLHDKAVDRISTPEHFADTRGYGDTTVARGQPIMSNMMTGDVSQLYSRQSGPDLYVDQRLQKRQ